MSEIRGRQRARRRRRWSFAVAVPALAATTAVVVALTAGGRDSETAFAASLVRVAESAPRLLVDGEGWQVVRADQFNINLGEMTFSNGQQRLEVRWVPDEGHAAAVEKRASESDIDIAARVAGHDARVFRYAGTNDYSAMWVQDGYSLEARGAAPNPDVFAAEVSLLHAVDVERWLSAMPASVVTPESRPGVARQMLADVPQPDGFDVSALETSGGNVRDRYHLGAEVTGAVACAWIGQWIDARRSGDDAAVRQAAGAMATSHSWAVLQEMTREGDYPEVLWMYADAMAGGAVVDEKQVPIEESYRSALGCTGS